MGKSSFTVKARKPAVPGGRPEVLRALSRIFWGALRRRYQRWAKRAGHAKQTAVTSRAEARAAGVRDATGACASSRWSASRGVYRATSGVSVSPPKLPRELRRVGLPTGRVASSDERQATTPPSHALLRRSVRDAVRSPAAGTPTTTSAPPSLPPPRVEHPRHITPPQWRECAPAIGPRPLSRCSGALLGAVRVRAAMSFTLAQGVPLGAQRAARDTGALRASALVMSENRSSHASEQR